MCGAKDRGYRNQYANFSHINSWVCVEGEVIKNVGDGFMWIPYIYCLYVLFYLNGGEAVEHIGRDAVGNVSFGGFHKLLSGDMLI